MAEPRSRRTGEHNAEIVKLLADAAQMRTRLAALEARVEKLEKELASARKAPAAKAPVVPPPLPRIAEREARSDPRVVGVSGAQPLTGRMSAVPPVPKSTGRKSVVDISDMAELVDSLPPPTQPSRVPRGR